MNAVPWGKPGQTVRDGVGFIRSGSATGQTAAGEAQGEITAGQIRQLAVAHVRLECHLKPVRGRNAAEV